MLYEIKQGVYELYYKYDADGNLFSITRYRYSDGARHVFYAITNSRGDVIELRENSGAVYATYTYDSWGRCVSVKNSSGNACSVNTVAVQSSIRYRGYVYDYETGLYYLQSRYYDPEVGRFLNADDVNYIGYSGETLSYNAFAYCENNAVNACDYLGNEIFKFLKKTLTFLNSFTNLLNDSLVINEPGPQTGMYFKYGRQTYHFTSEFYDGDDYEYDSSAERSLKNIIMGVLWNYAAIAVSLAYPDGYKFYMHYRNGKGIPLLYDYSKAINEDSAISGFIDKIKSDLKYCVRKAKLKSEKKYVISSILDHDVGINPSTVNWKLALGSHLVAVVATIENNNGIYYADLQIVAFDRYNFSSGKKFAGIISDDWNGELVSVGMADNFTSYGFAQISFKWRGE